MAGFCLMTNDVEDLSITGKSFHEIGEKVYNEAMPRMLDLYDKYGVKATMFFVAEYAAKYPEMIIRVQNAGHEIACHGLTHKQEFGYDVMPLDLQIQHLTQAKKILEDICGKEVVSFRSPALRVNEFTPQALREAGFLYDSSVAPQRMDMFMSLGSKNKMQWFGAPRTCYQTSSNNLARKGDSGIYEVPVSSFILPYIGTLMRISPVMNAMSRYLLYLETCNTKKVINFLFHPSEAVAETEEQMQGRKRTNNFISHIFSDLLRVKLKKRHLDGSAFELLEKEIAFWSCKKYEFPTMSEFVKSQIIYV